MIVGLMVVVLFSSSSRDYLAIVAGDGRGDVGPITTHLSCQKDIFGRGSHNGGLISYLYEHTSSNLTL